jgi:hypothetical protein
VAPNSIKRRSRLKSPFEQPAEAFQFTFPVNKSYKDSGHLTLRRRHNGVAERHIDADHFDVEVVAGETRIAGYLYRGKTKQRGRYYQLRMRKHEFSKLPAAYVDVQSLGVEVRFQGEATEVRLHPMS